MIREIDFVKTHAGFDEIIFLYGDQVPRGKELEIGLPLLRRPNLRGTEVGMLYEPEEDGDIKVKILERTAKGFIDMCGGLTQTLGKAVIETHIGKCFGIKVREPQTKFVLETKSGPILIAVDVADGIAKKITTDMRSYVRRLNRYGIEHVKIRDIDAMSLRINPSQVEFLIFRVDELKKKYPDVNFWQKDEPTLDILKMLYEHFLEEEGLQQPFLYSAIYDAHPNENVDATVVFRWYPTMYTPYYQEEDYEEACGTGTVAVGIAMIENGDLLSGNPNAIFQVGSEDLIDESRQTFTQLRMIVNEGKVTNAEFSHNLVELIASGKIYVQI